MKRFFFFCLLIILPTVSLSQSVSISETDGYWWNRIQSKIQKSAYIRGYVDGMSDVRIKLMLVAQGENPQHKDFAQLILDMDEDLVGVSVTQFVAGLDSLYSDYRYLDFKIYDAMTLVALEVKHKPRRYIELQKQLIIEKNRSTSKEK